jgi:hypothetical protein
MKIAKNTVTQAQINEWKAAFGHVYKTANGDDPIIYRPVRRSEYTKLMMETDLTDEEEEIVEKRIERTNKRREGICRISVLYPEDVDTLIESQAGLANLLAEEIMAHSGFLPLKESEEL